MRERTTRPADFIQPSVHVVEIQNASPYRSTSFNIPAARKPSLSRVNLGHGLFPFPIQVEVQARSPGRDSGSTACVCARSSAAAALDDPCQEARERADCCVQHLQKRPCPKPLKPTTSSAISVLCLCTIGDSERPTWIPSKACWGDERRSWRRAQQGPRVTESLRAPREATARKQATSKTRWTCSVSERSQR